MFLIIKWPVIPFPTELSKKNMKDLDLPTENFVCLLPTKDPYPPNRAYLIVAACTLYILRL